MKVLFLCETTDFQNFTRRATIEAFAQQKNVQVEALMNANVRFLPKINRYSEYLQVKCLFYLFIQRFSSGLLGIIGKVERAILQFLWARYVNQFEIVIFTQPNQEYLLPFFKNSRKVFLISDPYHLMGQKEDKAVLSAVKNIYQNVDLILVTAQNLKNTYIPKYIDKLSNKDIHYWPNTVDTSIWDYSKYKSENDSKSDTVGFIGNFMNVTDISLLEYLTNINPDLNFIIAGRITNSINTEERELLDKIFKRKNVEYLGLLPYNKVPGLVMSFSVGLLLDKKTELASYHHHNKFYQYLALGKPVVTLDYLDDYTDLNKKGVYISKNYEEYNASLQQALSDFKNDKKQKQFIQTAKDNNSEIRAKQLKSILKQYEN